MTITPELLEIVKKLLPIFFPYHTSRRDRMIESNGRFVHYTSAENAIKIINTKCVWMRNATCMSDYREVQHGFGVLSRYFANNESKVAFFTAMNECSPGLADEAFRLFDQWWQNTQLQTYITSISEHDNREDLHGRLSMWRAFGGATARVAIVIRLPLAVGVNEGLNATLSPVAYFTDEHVARELGSVVSNVRANLTFLHGIERAYLVNSVFTMLVTSVLTLKHEGFHEEKEWRVIYSPKRLPSTHIKPSTEIVGGVPQLVYKIPFKNNPDGNVSGLDPNELIDRVIIGPTQFPWAMYEAFVTALDAAGVKDAGSRVFVSQIPVRT
jgi:hypothetical protein